MILLKLNKLITIFTTTFISTTFISCSNKEIITEVPMNTNILSSEAHSNNTESIEKDTLNSNVSSTIDNTNADTSDIVLVNKKHTLSQSFVPNNLTPLNIPFNGAESSQYLTKEAAESLEKMFAAAKKDGINLIGKSGYRSYSTQKNNYETKLQTLGVEQATKFVAKPGASEHQLGLAIDIVSTEFSKLHTDFQYTETYKWLINNCADYGFILRYPKGKSDITGYNFEPWHYRYVGIEHAKKISNSKSSNNTLITLEEYLNEV